MRQGCIRAHGRMIAAGASPFPLRASGGLPAVMPRVPEVRSPGLHLDASAAQGPGRRKAQGAYFAAPATGVYGSMNSPSAFTGSHFS